MRAPSPFSRLARPERFRLSFRDAGGGLPLPLPQRRTWIAGLAVGLLFVIFAGVAVRQLASLRGHAPESVVDLMIFLLRICWVIGWSVGVVFLFLLTLLLLFYRESARVAGDRLIHVARLGPLRAHLEYDLDKVRNLRVVSAGKEGGRIRFDYGAAERGLGNDMPRREAESRVRMIQKAIDGLGGRRPGQATEGPGPRASAAAPVARAAPVRPAPPHPRATGPRGTLAPTAGSPRAAPAAAPARWSASTVALVGANVVPLAGVLLMDWSLGQVMVLFWAENAVIGAYTLLKLAIVAGWSFLLYGLFFLAHYGGFLAGHFVFVYYLFVRGIGDGGPEAPPGAALAEVFLPLVPAIAALVVSHGVSFATNFLGRKEYAGREVREQMIEPYRRVVILHVTIIIGGGLALILGSPLPALALLLVLKTGVDYWAHRREHEPAV